MNNKIYVLNLKLKVIAHGVENNFLLKALLSTPYIDKLLRDNKKTSREFLKDFNDKTKKFEEGTVLIYIIKFTEINGIDIVLKGIPLSYLLVNLLIEETNKKIKFMKYCKLFLIYLQQQSIYVNSLNIKELKTFIYQIEGTLYSLDLEYKYKFQK